MCFPIQVTESCAALHSHSLGGSIDENRSHAGEIDYQTVVAKRPATNVVSATTNRSQQTVGSCKIHRRNHVRKARTTRNHGRTFADACIPDLAGLIVADIFWFENLTAKNRPERINVVDRHGGKLYSVIGLSVVFKSMWVQRPN